MRERGAQKCTGSILAQITSQILFKWQSLGQSLDALSTSLSEVIPHTFRPPVKGFLAGQPVWVSSRDSSRRRRTLVVLVLRGSGGGTRCRNISGSVNNCLAGIYQFSQHAQSSVPFLLIPPLPPQDNNKNDSINPQVMGTLCMPSKQIRPSVN